MQVGYFQFKQYYNRSVKKVMNLRGTERRDL